MKNSIAIALAILFVLALFASCKRKDNNYYYEPSVSVVTGLLTTETVDTTEITDIGIIDIYVIRTTNPINVIWVDGNAYLGEETVNNISTIQLTGLDNFSEYLGKQVRLTGKFFHWYTGHHYTEVLMFVDKVEVLERRVAQNGGSIKRENYKQDQQTFNDYGNNDYYYPYPDSPDEVITYYYEPSVSVVTGIMTTKIMDPHDTLGTGLMEVNVIATDYPINVIEIYDDDYAEESKVYNARVFHVINNGIDFSVYKDKRVRLTGYFYLWDRYYHYSKAVLFAEKVDVIR